MAFPQQISDTAMVFSMSVFILQQDKSQCKPISIIQSSSTQQCVSVFCNGLVSIEIHHRDEHDRMKELLGLYKKNMTLKNRL